MIKYPPFPAHDPEQPTPEREHALRRHEAQAANRLVRCLTDHGYEVRLVMELGCMFVYVPFEAIDALPGNIWADAVSHGVQIVTP